MLSLKLSIEKGDLAIYVARQLNNFFPDANNVEPSESFLKYVSRALERVLFSNSHVKTKYYTSGNTTEFNHLNGDHYALFLYYLSNTIYVDGNNEGLASKVFLLNKALHGIDAFYSVKLPDIMILIHPIGTVLGNAVYGNFLMVYQNVTVGAVHGSTYPIFGEKTILYSKSSVIGNCVCGENVVFAANASVINTNVAKNTTVVGTYPNNKMIVNKTTVISDYFRI